MKQKRLESICSFLSKEDRIIDIGCDHAYLSIEMIQRGATKVLATDIHPKALESAKKNIAAANISSQVICKLSDGLKDIDMDDYNTLVIAGMGTSTIIHILSETDKLQNIQKIVLQSNNELPRLRQFMLKIGYHLQDEIVLQEKKHYYTIMNWIKKQSELKEEEIELGLWKPENRNYYEWLYQHEKKIKKSLSIWKWEKRKSERQKIKILTRYIKRCQTKKTG